jgi:flagellin-like protein
MEDMRKLFRNKKGVSEIVGTILLLGMAIALFVGVHIVAMNVIPYSPRAPSVRISGQLDNNIIYIQHNGGDSLPFGTKIIFSDYATGETIIDGEISIVRGHIIDDNGNDVWNIGEIIKYPNVFVPSLDFSGKIQMIIIDIESNAIIAQDVFQEVN